MPSPMPCLSYLHGNSSSCGQLNGDVCWEEASRCAADLDCPGCCGLLHACSGVHWRQVSTRHTCLTHWACRYAHLWCITKMRTHLDLHKVPLPGSSLLRTLKATRAGAPPGGLPSLHGMMLNAVYNCSKLYISWPRAAGRQPQHSFQGDGPRSSIAHTCVSQAGPLGHAQANNSAHTGAGVDANADLDRRPIWHAHLHQDQQGVVNIHRQMGVLLPLFHSAPAGGLADSWVDLAHHATWKKMSWTAARNSEAIQHLQVPKRNLLTNIAALTSSVARSISIASATTLLAPTAGSWPSSIAQNLHIHVIHIIKATSIKRM